MANVKIGSQASWNGDYVENLDGTKQLVPGDSGKIFMVDQGAAFTVNLPQIGTDIAGWSAKFILKTAAANAVHIMAYGLTNAGGTTGDAETVILSEYGSDTNDADSVTAHATRQDGGLFASGAVVGDKIEVFTDGTSWYCTSLVAQVAHSDDVDA